MNARRRPRAWAPPPCPIFHPCARGGGPLLDTLGTGNARAQLARLVGNSVQKIKLNTMLAVAIAKSQRNKQTHSRDWLVSAKKKYIVIIVIIIIIIIITAFDKKIKIKNFFALLNIILRCMFYACFVNTFCTIVNEIIDFFNVLN